MVERCGWVFKEGWEDRCRSVLDLGHGRHDTAISVLCSHHHTTAYQVGVEGVEGG